MEKNSKNKINLFFCINSLQRGGAEKQLNYITNYLSSKYNIIIFTLENAKIAYKFKSNIQIIKLNKYFLFFFVKKLFILKPQFVFFILPKSYFYFGTIMIFFPKIKKILMRRSLNYYHQNRLFRYYEIFLHKFTNFFICNSYSAKKNLIELEFVSKKKIFVIDNYIKFKSFNAQIRNNKKFKILCISNFYKYKGHRLLLKSLSLIKTIPWELYLMGESRDLQKKNIKATSKNLGIQNRVKFIKNIKKNYCYPNFSLGALFSKTESFPNAVLEYCSLKLPILAFDVGDIKRLVNKKNGILLKTRDPNHISRRILDLYYDKNLNIKSKFSIQNVRKFSDVNKTLGKYDKLINMLYVWNNR